MVLTASLTSLEKQRGSNERRYSYIHKLREWLDWIESFIPPTNTEHLPCANLFFFPHTGYKNKLLLPSSSPLFELDPERLQWRNKATRTLKRLNHFGEEQDTVSSTQ